MKKEQWKEDLRIGDVVIVKNGIICPDFNNLEIGGWKGDITEVTEDDKNDVLICIKWDEDTIKIMPKAFLDNGNEEGLDNDLMYLYPEDVKLVIRK